MKSENQIIVRCKQPIKIEKLLQRLLTFSYDVGERNYGAIFKAQIMAEKRENNKEFVNSQSSQLEEEHLGKLEADSEPENIKKKKQTSWRLKNFTQWLEKRKINCDLLSLSPAELNGILRRFYADEKRNQKTDLTPSALTGIEAAIHPAISGQPIQGQ